MAKKPKKIVTVMSEDLKCRECGASPSRRGDAVDETAVEYTCCVCITLGRKRDPKAADEIKERIAASEVVVKTGADIVLEEKYGPMRKVVEVIKELTPKSVQVRMDCGHERATPKTMAKQCRCVKCRPQEAS